MSPPDVTVAVVSWNTRDLLERCLTALEREPRAAVWVVDNGSQDGSPALVRERFGAVELLEPGENLGFGRAVNLVAARTSTPWLVCANADTAPEPGALEELLRAAARDPRAGALAPALVLPDGSLQHSAYAFPSLPFTLRFQLGLLSGDRHLLEGRWDPARGRRVPWSIAAFLLLRRTAFDQVGGFDPAQWLYAEDLDLGWRLARSGWHTRHVPAARVRHESAAATSQAWGERRRELWQAATYEWIARRRGRRRARAIAGVNVAGAAIRAAAWTLAARAGGGAGAAWRRDRARGWARVHRAAAKRALSTVPRR